jgi:hypothetical protein
MDKQAYHNIFDHAPGLYLIVSPDHPRYTILDVDEEIFLALL